MTDPIATVINNNQPGWTNIIETAPNVTLDVGTKLYLAHAPSTSADVAGIVKRLRGAPQAMAMGHVSHAYNAKACYEAADLIERQHAQLAAQSVKLKADEDAWHEQEDELQELRAENAALRRHANALCITLEGECADLGNPPSAVAAYRAFTEK